jgi:hypothetical protein
MDIKQSKSILARLLAKENLTVQHKNIPTAYFDTKNRLLALPIWKDMSTDLYDLLTGHEVGHALYTPAQGWHDQIMDKDFGDHFKGFLNVLEDARIEKLVKRQYPGIRKNFYQAYKELYEKDFFGVADTDLDDLLFIDRINLHFKVGAFLNIEFTAQEQELITEIEGIETWDEVVAIAKRLYVMAQEELKDKQMRAQGDLMKMEITQDDEGKGQGEQDEDFDLGENESEALAEKIQQMSEPESLTDKAFRDRETELLDEKSLPFNYYTLGEYDANPYVWSYKTMLELHTFTPEQEARRGQVYAAFRLKNLKFINYLVKEFELRRNAQQLSRAQVSKSGEIDVDQLFKYKFSEDLFLKVTNIPKGKNHGLVMFYDMSGSMSNSIAGVIEQILILVEFCRKVNIPFEVYGFTNDNRVFWQDDSKTKIYQEQALLRRGAHVDGQLVITDNDFRLQQYFSNNMSANDYKKMVGNLCMIQKTWMNNIRRFGQEYDYDWSGSMPACEHLHSTPLNATILLSRNIFERFKARTGAEIVNMVILTDGESDQCIKVANGYYGDDQTTDKRYNYVESGWHSNTFITDNRTKNQVQVKGRHASKSLNVALLEIMRTLTGCNIVGFYLANNVRGTVASELRMQSDNNLPIHEERIMEQFKRDRVAILTQAGYNEYYIVKNDMAINDDFEVADDANVKDIGRAFRKMQKGKVLNRVLLNRFIKMIA